jgi:hypothetical protein
LRLSLRAVSLPSRRDLDVIAPGKLDQLDHIAHRSGLEDRQRLAMH